MSEQTETSDRPSVAVVEAPDPEVSSRPLGRTYIARQVSDLEFDDRLLDLVEDDEVPLLERVKFLSLFGERIDEFFQVQVGGLHRQRRAGNSALSIDGQTPSELLGVLREKLDAMLERAQRLLAEHLSPALAAHGIHVVRWSALEEAERRELDDLFRHTILPVLTPLTVDPSHPFPYISNLSLSVGTVVKEPGAAAGRFARVKVPPNVPRLLALGGGTRFVPLEEVVAAHLGELFPAMEVGAPWFFRVTRDADLILEEDDIADDLLVSIQNELRRRRFLPVVRLEVDERAPDDLVEQLAGDLDIGPADVYRTSRGPLGFDGMWAIYDIDRADLRDEPWSPLVPPALAGSKPEEPPSIFEILDQRDVLVHHPYESFTSSVEELVRQAADDPHVLAIKQCLYRTSGDSPVVAALVQAAERGKQVAVLVELTARFDEEANIGWARALEEVGAHVVYGLAGLKTHSKTTLIVRETDGAIRRYCHVGTGNYNPKTARIYEDLGLLTSRESVGQDLTSFFNHLTGFGEPSGYNELVTSPRGIREAVLEEIAQETKAGRDGRIVIKVNGIDDRPIIDALYEASEAGVSIDLIVRGIVCLRPGVPGLSEHIRVRSIVGRFLEHARILRFGGGGRPARYYIGSSDLRRRNLDRRVEAMIPIGDRQAQATLDEILELNLADDRFAWTLDEGGVWQRPTRISGLSAQEELRHLALVRNLAVARG